MLKTQLMIEHELQRTIPLLKIKSTDKTKKTYNAPVKTERLYILLA
jgi:hypothetical protein